MNAPAATRMTALIHGRVQGVGFRGFVRRHALDLGLCGYVENLPDGRVEVVAEGERSEIDHLLVKMRAGPPHAEVTEIETVWGEGAALRGFFIY